MKPTIIAIIISSAFVLGALMLSSVEKVSTESVPAVPVNNVTVENGKQIVSITAKGGYSPRLSKAKADMPTILKVETTGTFDCSSALNLPSINYRKNLPQSGVTEIELPPQKAGSTFEGLCSMGMYGFNIVFE